MSEEIQKLKETAEKAMLEFTATAKKLNEMGYNCHAKPDGNLYIWKDVREAYGTPPAPTTNAVVVTPQSNGKDNVVQLR